MQFYHVSVNETIHAMPGCSVLFFLLSVLEKKSYAERLNDVVWPVELQKEQQ